MELYSLLKLLKIQLCQDMSIISGWANGREVVKLWDIVLRKRANRVISVAEELATIKTEDVEKAFAEMLAGRRPKLSQLEELKKLNKMLRSSVRILQKGTFSLE
jgi:hypothetical protein